MTLAPFYAAPLFVKLHILAALLVVALTPVQFLGFSKGSPAHRTTGTLWLLAMVAVALTSLTMTSRFHLSIGGFGPIHLLSLLTLASCFWAWQAARRHEITRHRLTLVLLTLSFFVAGAFTFLPGRIMHRIIAG
ncbi:MAG: DUF2306 domain-containing protein [Beijerinckiaceae bacterium]|nr:DUF2306 domain-containing protein [Beijerinckiaceae bacterium]MCZ8299814.1 DUF2306 domain-containing protein [Beijerinckiaceae bacterium]